MTWARLDDKFHGHRKVRRAWMRSRASIGLHVMALSYCAERHTGGLVDEGFVAELLPMRGERMRAIYALETAGLWDRVDAGWLIKDFRSSANQDVVRAARIRAAHGSCSKGAARARFDYYGGRCWICHAPATTMDHVKPLAAGGSLWPANLRPACRPCNSRKRDRWPYEVPR